MLVIKTLHDIEGASVEQAPHHSALTWDARAASAAWAQRQLVAAVISPINCRYSADQRSRRGSWIRRAEPSADLEHFVCNVALPVAGPQRTGCKPASQCPTGSVRCAALYFDQRQHAIALGQARRPHGGDRMIQYINALIGDALQVPPADVSAGAGLQGLIPAVDYITLLFRQTHQRAPVLEVVEVAAG